MLVHLGFDASARRRGETLHVTWDSEKIANPHIMLAGMSGAGKTHLIRDIVKSMVETSNVKLRIHIFDVHGDIEIPGASTVMFSEQTSHGLRPLRISPDPHYGGVRKRIQTFIDTINRVSSSPLGTKQISVLRNLLLDVYKMHGFEIDNPSTWHVNSGHETLVDGGADNRLYLSVPIAEKDDAKSLGAKWDTGKKLWWIPTDQYSGSITKWLPATIGRSNPSVEEVLIYAKRLYVQSFLGSDQNAIMNLEVFNKAASAYQRKALTLARMGRTESDPTNKDELDALDKFGKKAVLSYANFVESVRTGFELESLMKYDSTDVLKSVVDRLETLVSTGLFKSKNIPFDPNASVWRYKLDPLRTQEKLMFVLFRLEELWDAARERGQCDDVVDVFVMDEFGIYATTASSDKDNIINVLAQESRKYGISLLVAGQNPEAFPDGLISSIGTKIILGVDESYWKTLTNKMRIDDALLNWIKLRQSIAVQFKETGATKNEWKWVYLK